MTVYYDHNRKPQSDFGSFVWIAFLASFLLPSLKYINFDLLAVRLQTGLQMLISLVVQFLPVIIPSLGLVLVGYFGFKAFYYHTNLQLQKRQKEEKQEESLYQVFYQLLEEKNGYVTVLELAMKAKVSGLIAKQFLEEKTRDFNYKIAVSKDGEIAYKFDFLTKEEVKSGISHVLDN